MLAGRRLIGLPIPDIQFENRRGVGKGRVLTPTCRLTLPQSGRSGSTNRTFCCDLPPGMDASWSPRAKQERRDIPVTIAVHSRAACFRHNGGGSVVREKAACGLTSVRYHGDREIRYPAGRDAYRRLPATRKLLNPIGDVVIKSLEGDTSGLLEVRLSV